jgi:hypothetical protein
MKKLLIFMLVLAMTTGASATVIDLVKDGTGDLGGDGTSGNPLVIGEKINLKVILNYHQEYPASPTYDGYGLSSIDLRLDAGSAGTFEVPTTKKNDASLGKHADFATWAVNDESLPDDDGQADQLDVGSDIDSITGTESGSKPIRADIVTPGPADIVWNITFVASTAGTWTIDVSKGPSGQYGEYTVSVLADGSGPYDSWQWMVDADVGDLTGLVIVPEPTTIALLGLGGLFLSRRRR